MVDLPPGLVVYREVQADEVRAIDIYTNRVSEPVEVGADGAPTEVVLDLTDLALVRGTVQVPEGFSPDEARVILTADGFDPGRDQQGRPGRGLGTQARFAVWVPADRPATISVWHPFLVPDPARGKLSVRGAAEGAVLALVTGRFAVLCLTGAGSPAGGANVRLYRGAVGGEPVREEHVPVADGAIRFGGYEPGKYTVWIDVPGFAPLIVGEAELGEEQTDLGTVALSPGATLVVRLRPQPGRIAARTTVEVQPLDGPIYRRSGRSGENGEARITGLLPGRYRVTAWGTPSETVEVRGDGETVITMDLP
jgi:hypothetical protein